MGLAQRMLKGGELGSGGVEVTVGRTRTLGTGTRRASCTIHDCLKSVRERLTGGGWRSEQPAVPAAPTNTTIRFAPVPMIIFWRSKE